jgi:hypothetical protein
MMNRRNFLKFIAAKIPYSERPEFYTVAGHKRLINGVLITDCDPGEETIFKARLIRN